MPKRSSKPADVNQLAKAILDEATANENLENKNPAAVALGRLGGQKGGPARAKSLTAKQRKAIAEKAAQARWSKERKS